MDATLSLLDLAGAIALLLWGVRLWICSPRPTARFTNATAIATRKAVRAPRPREARRRRLPGAKTFISSAADAGQSPFACRVPRIAGGASRRLMTAKPSLSKYAHASVVRR